MLTMLRWLCVLWQVKCATLFVGVLLAYAVRNAPSQFNEATLLSICIYNVSVLLMFIVPLVHAGVGGRLTLYLIRAFAVIFISVTTLMVFFIPKSLALRTRIANTPAMTQIKANNNHSTPDVLSGAGTEDRRGTTLGKTSEVRMPASPGPRDPGLELPNTPYAPDDDEGPVRMHNKISAPMPRGNEVGAVYAVAISPISVPPDDNVASYHPHSPIEQ